MQGPFADHILDASDVCINCLRQIRVERVDPTRGGITRDYEQSLERHRDHTTVAYGPADSVSDQKGVFCECGVESAFDRYWDDDDVDKPQFRELVKALLATLNAKGVTVDRKRTAQRALSEYRRRYQPQDTVGVIGRVPPDVQPTIDECLSRAVEHGIRAAVARSSSSGYAATGD